MLDRSSSSVSNSLAARARSSSSGGRIFSLHLADGHLDRSRSCRRPRERDLLRLAGRRADERVLELRRHAPGAELDDRVALRLALGVDEVDDERVARLRGASVRRSELGHRLAQRLDLGVDRLLRHLRLGARRPRASSSRRSPAAAAPRRSRRSSTRRRRSPGARTRTAGSATGRRRLRDAALQNQPPMWLSTASE